MVHRRERAAEDHGASRSDGSRLTACSSAVRTLPRRSAQLFERMRQDSIHPNTITFNSLITACGQGLQFSRAAALFEGMREQGCTPDVVSYTAIITACGRVCKWRRAMQVRGDTSAGMGRATAGTLPRAYRGMRRVTPPSRADHR